MPGKNGIKFGQSRRHAQNVAIRADYHRLGAHASEPGALGDKIGQPFREQADQRVPRRKRQIGAREQRRLAMKCGKERRCALAWNRAPSSPLPT